MYYSAFLPTTTYKMVCTAVLYGSLVEVYNYGTGSLCADDTKTPTSASLAVLLYTALQFFDFEHRSVAVLLLLEHRQLTVSWS
jgi:hypothetical protein